MEFSRNGRVRPDYVALNGRGRAPSRGPHYRDWYDGGKRKRLSVDKEPATAFARKLRKGAEPNALSLILRGLPMKTALRFMSGGLLKLDKELADTLLRECRRTDERRKYKRSVGNHCE